MAGAVSVALFSHMITEEELPLMPQKLAVALFCTFAALIWIQDSIRFINLLPIYTRSHLKRLPTVTRNRCWHYLFYGAHGVLWMVLFALPFLTVRNLNSCIYFPYSLQRPVLYIHDVEFPCLGCVYPGDIVSDRICGTTVLDAYTQEISYLTEFVTLLSWMCVPRRYRT